LLRDLGHDVVEAGRPRNIDWSADLYYGWWWGHAPFLVPPAKLRGKPLVITGAFDYATCRAELPGLCFLDRPAWQQVLLKSMLRIADANLFISQYEHDEVTAALQVRNPIAMPLAIDTAYYEPGSGVTPGDYFFAVSLQTRTNAIRKGLPQSIDAFARVADALPGTRLVIAGKPGDYTEVLKAQAAERGVGDRVEFVGMIDEATKLRGYRECIAYVQPTLYEGFGHALAEAVACGANVVSAARGAVPEVTGGHAACVDPHDVDAIAAAMLAAAQTPPSAETRAVRHRWIADNFSMATRRDRLGALIASLT